jgi:uncharacterized protein (TIGR00255 family)
MIYSMTGYALTTFEFRENSYTIELKSLNSKGLEINFKSCQLFRNLELNFKNILQRKLQRGKIDLYINLQKTKTALVNIDEASFVEKYEAHLNLAHKVGANTDMLFTYLLNNNSDTSVEVLTEAEIQFLEMEIDKATEILIQYRKNEGISLAQDFENWISNIEALKKTVESIDSRRIDAKRSKILANFEELNSKMDFDKNRLEQEMIYFIEKLDISEEISRLNHHLALFITTVALDEPIGRKLNFIAQEIGREINTIGSKANDFEMQHNVVEMKDNLEKIKEQINNVL